MISKNEIEIFTRHYPGYGSPECWTIRVIWQNRLLEQIDHITSEHELGKIEGRLEGKWLRDWPDDAFDSYPLASRPCDNCGGRTVLKSTSVGEKVFCQNCDGAPLEAYRAELIAARDAMERQFAKQAANRKKQAEAEKQDAQCGFHWRDGWFFLRMSEGQVRISHVESGPYVLTQLMIPENEWASIVASVSADGETGDRWQAVRDFHAGAPLAVSAREEEPQNG